MERVTFRRGVQAEDPLGTALAFLEAYPVEAPRPGSFDEDDLLQANRGGARISAAEQAAILERRDRIDRALSQIEPGASLTELVQWDPLERLFEAFAGIRGVGFSKMTKALHPKRPELIPMLDSVVQAYLAIEHPPASFAEHATALVRGYKQDLDRNRTALRALRRKLASRGHEVTEVRILDILIWSA